MDGVGLLAFVTAPPRHNVGGFDAKLLENELMACIAPEERLLKFDGFEGLDPPDAGLGSTGVPATY